MKKILLVDDSKTVAKLLSDKLSEGGYQVVSCSDVDSAIAAYTQDQIGIGLVITDLIMPGKDGNDLIDYLHKNAVPGSRPKILVISGGSKGTVTSDTAVMSVKDRVEAVMTKPFKPEQLITVVNGLLG